jgi:predicted ATPase/DNA-binding SARP family transcriptional activator
VTAIGVLGPLLLSGPEGPIPVRSARQRRLLAALVAHVGAPLGTDLLTELIWDSPPANPAAAVQTNVARLRPLLPPGIRILTAPEGYQLHADRAAVDVTAYTDHLAAAAMVSDAHLRLARLEAGQRLWRGRPYAELDHPSLHPEVARLNELRAGAAEQYGDALLAVGRTAEAVAALEALALAEPLREGGVALLMRAMVAAGRHADALAVFGRLRARLAEELGLDPSAELRALEQQVLRQEVMIPASASGSRPGVQRPPGIPVSSFVGRDADLTGVGELLAACRVVTLCGPGGVGKTRLARHVAVDVAGRFDDGVLFVELGDGGPADVDALLAAALRLADDGRAGPESFTERIVETLAARMQLLVLDNCEHVAAEVAALVEAISAGAAGVHLLLTSREPLRVDGEHVFPVDPLEPGSAARLLVDRIRTRGPAPDPEPDEAELVAALCRRLDGLPLALELAAARAVPLGLRGLLAAFDAAPDHPLDVLRGGRRTASPRHRSLRDVVDWSYELLDEDQRGLFERLAVFAGPVEYSAVVAVCGDAAALPDLVDRSLVVRHAGDPARFGMLETLRAYGRSRLPTNPAAASLRARHANWALQLAEQVMRDRLGPGEAAAVRRFDAHLADLRRAHAWLSEAGPTEHLLRLGVSFGLLAGLRGRIDLVRLVEDTLVSAGVLRAGSSPAGAHPLAATLLGLLAMARWQRGDLHAAEALSRQAISIADAAREPTAACWAHESLANVLAFRGDLDVANRHARRALELADLAGDRDCQVLALTDLVIHTAYTGDDGPAARFEADLALLVSRLDYSTARAWLAYARGERRAELRDPDSARYLEDAILAAEQVGSDFIAGIARHTLLTAAARDGNPAAALAAFGPLIDHWYGFGAWTQLWIAVRSLIETLSRLGRHGDVAVLLGAGSASTRAPRVFGADLARARAVERAARDALGDTFETLRAEGAALGDAGAVGLARRLTRDAAVGRLPAAL